MFFVFHFVYMVDYIDHLSYVKPLLHLWDKANLTIVDNLFDVVLNLSCRYFIQLVCLEDIFFYFEVKQEEWIWGEERLGEIGGL